MILLDTNILTCIKQAAHPDYARVTQRLIGYLMADVELVVCPQVLYEFYVVATRPSYNHCELVNNKVAWT